VEGYFSDIVFENFINRQEVMVMGPPPWAFISRRGLREVVLWLLSDRPMNGAEIIRAVEEFTWGFWKPSPGSVYPLLKQLEAEGLVRRRQDGRYELTEAGGSAARLIPWARIPRPGSPKSIDEVVEELESWAMYLLDVAVTGPDRVAPYRERIRQVGEMLLKI
jgi:DNA-binding PadR family transcriptional regulator